MLVFSRIDTGYQFSFSVITSKGLLRTGLVSGDFTTTVVNPTDTATISPTVSETLSKPGLYTFLIPSSFLVTHGVGVYRVVVEVGATGPKLNDAMHTHLQVSESDFDTIVASGGSVPAVIFSITV